jgi:peptidyl-prolyl cis-trans isomerase SurA
MAAADPALKSLIREYHDGLLLYEISNRTVWDKAAKDEAGLAAYFKKNRKRYKWEKPRFKGIAYWVKEQGDVEAVKASLKKVPFEQWPEHLRKEFNDSTIRIKVVKGIFREGDNALIDKVVFGKDTTVADVKDFPISATYGEKLKAPKTCNDVRELVVTDYQEQLEKAWIEALRKRYTVVLNKEVLSTVNKH